MEDRDEFINVDFVILNDCENTICKNGCILKYLA